MDEKKVKELFPRASKAFILANAVPLDQTAKQATPTPLSVRKRRGLMNKTESEYALMLQARLQQGDILRFEFEGITLRWADMRYTPDFIVFHRAYIKLIEVKGAHIWDRDIVRFKGARAFWPEFKFEMWQKTKIGWSQKF